MMVEGIFTSLYVGVQALLCQPNIWHHHFCLGISLSNEDNVHYDPEQQALNTDSIAEAESLFFFLLGILTYIGTQIHQHLKFLYSLRVYCYVLVSVSSHILSPVHLSLRDVLPFTLKLPEAIASATTRKELEEVAQLGAGSLICYLTGLIFCMNTQPHLS